MGGKRLRIFILFEKVTSKGEVLDKLNNTIGQPERKRPSEKAGASCRNFAIHVNSPYYST